MSDQGAARVQAGDDRRIHFLGIGGRAMGGLAVALARAGYRVTGSDEGMYEPMSTWLRRAAIDVAAGYAERNIPLDASVVIVGKRIAEDNRELRWVLRRGIPFLSFPKFLQTRFLHRSLNAVVAGGVGKTTTAAMLAWILEHAGRRPDYLIGGMPGNFENPARFDGARLTVLEGDEYASCFDDPAPKFLHYAPEVAVVTNLLDDHPDLYPDSRGLHDAFLALVRLLPKGGCLVLPQDDEACSTLAAQAGCRVVTTGQDPDADRPITDLKPTPQGTAFRLAGTGFALPMCGRMNVHNAAMAILAAAHLDVSPEQSARALAEFKGVRERQEARDVGGCTVVTDKASHPHSLSELCGALRQRYPRRRVVSVIQPRGTGGRRWIYQRDLPAALASFDKVILTSAYEHRPPEQTAWEHEPFCIDTLARDLGAQAVDVTVVPALADVPDAVGRLVQDGDVVVMSLREQFVGEVLRVEEAILDRHRRVIA